MKLSSAQTPLKFRKYHPENGLSNGFVTSIFQDSQGFLWLGTAGGVNRFDGYTFKSFQHDVTNPQSISHQTTWAIGEDKEAYLWFGTEGGLNRFDPNTETFICFLHDPNNPKSISSSNIESIQCDPVGNLWVGTDNGLNLKRSGSDKFKRYWYQQNGSRPVKSIILARDKSLWLGSLDTLFQYDYKKNDFLAYPLPKADPVANEIRVIYEDPKGNLWVGTQMNGAFHFDKNTRHFTQHLLHNPLDATSLSHNKITSFVEYEGKLWIGTYGGGLNIYDLLSGKMDRYTNTPPNPQGVNSETIRAIFKDNQGNIWLGSFYDGLYQYNTKQHLFLNFDHTTGLTSKTVNSLALGKDGNIWVAMANGGIGMLDYQKKEFIKYLKHNPQEPNSLPDDDVQEIRIDALGQVWLVSGRKTVSVYSPSENRFKVIISPEKFSGMSCLDWIERILPEPNGDIWLGSQNGLCKFIQANQSIKSYNLPSVGNTDIKHEKNIFVTCFLKDKKGDLWVATYGGLNRYHAQTDSFSFYPFPRQILSIFEDQFGTIWVDAYGLRQFDKVTQKFVTPSFKGLRYRVGQAMIEDDKGFLWTSNGAGLQRLNPKNGEIINFNKKDGLVSNHFWTSTKAADGYLYFGGTDGMVGFHPDRISTQKKAPTIVLTDFRLFNKTLPIRKSNNDTLAWRSPLKKSITQSTEITLLHWQNYFSIEFAALDFSAPENNVYRYKLEGYDKVWVETNAQNRRVTYTNLNPGTYTFRAQAALMNGPWNETGVMLKIRILAPWWQTWWAYLLYASLFFAIVITIYRFQLYQKLAQNEAKRLKELDLAKNRLFTNVTHEFRTPLTVILGMVEKMQEDPKTWLSEGLAAIKRNGQRVLHLVNQMLDLSRLEFGSMPLHFQQGDVIPFLSYLVQSYESYAASRDIQFVLHKRVNSVVMDFSPDALTKIMNNLLSNAFKYTPKGGSVEISLDQIQDRLFIEIKDTGQGIPSEHLPYIFDRFYQVDATDTRKAEGAGIGLALVKELMDHLKGEIQVSSTLNQGTTFQIKLPITHQAESTQINYSGAVTIFEKGSTSDEIAIPLKTNTDLPIILIIEDHEDVARYIAGCLAGHYQVHIALHGKKGIECIFELIPDLIICDVMMPEMDGYQVCQILKNDERSSHIPLLMLTAKVDTDARLEGFRRGADAYLAKPFHPEELELRLHNLVHLSQRIQHHFAAFPKIQQPEEEFIKEHEFLIKLKGIIRQNMIETDFGIPELCHEIGISRSQLHRKLKALTNQSTSHIIRSVRLEEAHKLLLQSDLPISEIAYQVGFDNPNYFSTVFSENYGLSPSEIRKKGDMQQ